MGTIFAWNQAESWIVGRYDLTISVSVKAGHWTHGLDSGLRFGLDFGLIRSSMTTISNMQGRGGSLVPTPFFVGAGDEARPWCARGARPTPGVHGSGSARLGAEWVATYTWIMRVHYYGSRKVHFSWLRSLSSSQLMPNLVRSKSSNFYSWITQFTHSHALSELHYCYSYCYNIIGILTWFTYYDSHGSRGSHGLHGSRGSYV